MKRYVQYEPFNIYCFESNKWEHPVHKHTYSEIIFIRKGNGKHIINDNEFSYSNGDVFLLGPEDYHVFKIENSTAFFYIRFTEDFFTSKNSPNHKSRQKTIEDLLKSPYRSQGSIINNKEEKNVLDHLLSVLYHEYNNRSSGSYELMMDSLMKAILSVLARNIIKAETILPLKKSSKVIEEILIYIRQNIHEPKLLRMENLSRIYNYSENYLSIYFKKQTGESLQQYIQKYKLRQLEDRLLFSDFNISQIANEFGFTDISHFHKVFRKHFGVSPKDFRKRLT